MGGHDPRVPLDLFLHDPFGLLQLNPGRGFVVSLPGVAEPLTDVSLVQNSERGVRLDGEQVIEGHGVVQLDLVDRALGIAVVE